jgi:hypothetical protein
MKISRFLAIAGLVAAGTAAAHDGGNSSTLFRFNGGTGNQVFRSAAGVPTLNTVAGVNPAGAPWRLMKAILSGWVRQAKSPVLLVPIPAFVHVQRYIAADGYLARFRELGAVPPAVSAAHPLAVQLRAGRSDEDGDFVVRGGD